MSVTLQLLILLDVAIASILAGMVGFEREVSNKPAGFRTHMIIGGASALLISLGEVLVHQFQDEAFAEYLRIDPIRIIEAIVVGLSFIGAGTILKSEQSSKVYYLTTAATTLFTAGIGISVALKQYVLAVGVTILVLTINYAVRFFEDKFSPKKPGNPAR